MPGADRAQVEEARVALLRLPGRPGGELVLASPYAWQSSVMDERERIGGADPAAAVAAILRDGTDLSAPYRIEEEAEISWTLRRDARSAVAYRTHFLRARKT